tara:strand:- start:519 stop:1109 length:591 start_codon:yes stop_codon:yes gene_type:complete
MIVINDIDKLNKSCKPCESIEEGEKIGAQLLDELSKSKRGVGLAANQIGINKRVCVVNVKEPIVFINPKIVNRSKEEFIFPESCLSFPNVMIKTKRNVSIEVESDNHPGKMMFTSDSEDMDLAFECACVQHEIDHLDGITMFDREFKSEPMKRGVNAPIKIGRNEKVTITKGSESKTIKYKKAESLLEDGWTLVEA